MTDLVIEHMRFGPLMMSCDRAGISNFLKKMVVRGGQHRNITICSGCHKEVIHDEKVPGSYNPAKPHVAGSMLTIRPDIIYYPVQSTDNLIFPINLSKPIPSWARDAVSKLATISGRMAG